MNILLDVHIKLFYTNNAHLLNPTFFNTFETFEGDRDRRRDCGMVVEGRWDS